ncbi:MAG TPA: prephenate dehydrogenase/arogenate dehydrogenase family protein [Acidimicrobiia bacterium]|nr:prephenate dehydrogenase/arogenate dehydrogenase family protein [Acidimicrobiia bacterium]
MAEPTSVALVGTGLIGGSIGLALRRAGVTVCGFDRDRARAAAALDAGAVDQLAPDLAGAVADADLTVVAVPVGHVADVVVEALDAGARLVTDVGSVKAPVVAAVEASRPDAAPRYVGGHPMAGSEQEGLAGASPDLFVGATWVLTPTGRTDPAVFAEVRSWVSDLGAEVIAVAPELHDALVAVVSHVPQLAASTLMNVANRGGDDHAVLLRLAAGGFRDMTRIASSHPAIWPDICLANRDAIVGTLDDYLDELARVRRIVADGDRDALLALLADARAARRNLPVGIPVEESLVELRVPVEDREGVIADVTTLAARFGINIADLEIAHSIEGRAGVLVLVVADRNLDAFEAALVEHGFHVARTPLS